MIRPSFSSVWIFATGRAPQELPAHVRRAVRWVALADLAGCVVAIPSAGLDVMMLSAGVGTATRDPLAADALQVPSYGHSVLSSRPEMAGIHDAGVA